MDLQTMENEWQDLKRENAALKAELAKAKQTSVLCAKAYENADAENEKLLVELAAAQKIVDAAKNLIAQNLN